MPRQSAESRSAAAFRAGAEGLPPPKHLRREAKELWRSIVASKPPDWFDAGSGILLERYVECALHWRALWGEIERLEKAQKPNGKQIAALERRACRFAQLLARLASSLRLSVQAAVNWHSRKNGERGAGANAQPGDDLLGGEAVHGRRKPN
jgi:hypothetical protein